MWKTKCYAELYVSLLLKAAFEKCLSLMFYFTTSIFCCPLNPF